jgi:hypothetical protein
MKTKVRVVAAMGASALLAACHGSFYGGGDLGVSYVSPTSRHNAAATTTASMLQSTTPSANELTVPGVYEGPGGD